MRYTDYKWLHRRVEPEVYLSSTNMKFSPARWIDKKTAFAQWKYALQVSKTKIIPINVSIISFYMGILCLNTWNTKYRHVHIKLKYSCSIHEWVGHIAAQRQYFIHGKIFEIRLEKMKGFLWIQKGDNFNMIRRVKLITVNTTKLETQ